MSGVYSIPRSVRNVWTVGDWVYTTQSSFESSRSKHTDTGRCLFPKFGRAEAEQQHFWKQIIMVAEFNHEFIANIIHPVDEIIII